MKNERSLQVPVQHTIIDQILFIFLKNIIYYKLGRRKSSAKRLFCISIVRIRRQDSPLVSSPFKLVIMYYC